MANINYVAQAFNLASTISKLLPIHKDDYPAADNLIAEICQYITNQSKFYPFAALNALASFPSDYLRTINNIELASILHSSLEKAKGNDVWLRYFLVKWMEQDISNMPRSLFIGTSSSKTVSCVKNIEKISLQKSKEESLLEKLSSTWKNDPVYAISYFYRHTDDDLTTTFNQIAALPSLSFQHWIIRLEFFRSLDYYVYRSLISLQDDPEYIKKIIVLETSLLERIKNGQIVSTIFYSIIMWVLLQKSRYLIEGDASLLSLTVERLLSTKLLPERFGNNEEIQGGMMLAIHTIHHYLSSDKQSFAASWVQEIYDKISPNSWLKVMCELLFSWNVFDATNGKSCTIQIPEYLLVAENIIQTTPNEAFDKVKNHSSEEPQSAKGLYGYCSGITFRRDAKFFIETTLKALSSPGPAIKKIEFCCTLSGAVGLGSNNQIQLDMEIVNILREALVSLLEKADSKMAAWYTIILYRIIHYLSSDTKTPDSFLTRASPGNRFDIEKPFGICFELLLSGTQPHIREAIVQSMNYISIPLPRIDWNPLADHLSDSFLFKHLHTASKNGEFYNPSLLNIIFTRLENDMMSLDSLSKDVLLKLFAAIKSDEESAKRFVAILESRSFANETLMCMLLRNESLFDRSTLMSMVSKFPLSSALCKAKADSSLFDDPLSRYLQSFTLTEALSAIYQDPSVLEIVSLEMRNPKIIPDLFTFYFLAFRDAADTDILSKLILSVLRNQAHPLIRQLSVKWRDILAWQEYCDKHPELAKSCTRRMQVIVPMINPSDPISFLFQQ